MTQRGTLTGTVVTLGGGGFSMSEDLTSPIDDLILGLAGRARPRVCFVPTASGDDPGYVERFESAFAGRAETSVLSLFDKDGLLPADRVEVRAEHVLDADVVYVGGGSTANLLALWRLHGLDRQLRDAAARGTVLAGISAGMNCWFEASSTDSFGPLAPLRDGLGWLRGAACPHYLGEADRRQSLHRWVQSGELPDAWAADDFTALVWRDGELVEAVGEREGRQVVRVVRGADGGVDERPVPTRLLG